MGRPAGMLLICCVAVIRQLHAGWTGSPLEGRGAPCPFGSQQVWFGGTWTLTRAQTLFTARGQAAENVKFLIKIEINPLPQLPAISSRMSKSFMLLINVITR